MLIFFFKYLNNKLKGCYFDYQSSLFMVHFSFKYSSLVDLAPYSVNVEEKKNEHQNMNTSEGPWNPDEHTNIEKSTSFGTVQFSGFGKESSKRDAWVNMGY